MTVRINHNIASMGTARNLGDVDRRLAESLERLSSGFRINRAADSPSGLVASEQMRGQIAGVTQAIANTELATAILRTAEGAIGEANNVLISMRGLALHAANEGANDPLAAEADNMEIRAGLDAIARIAANTTFGRRNLLDGSSGIVGEAQGQGLAFLGATQRTRSSPIAGYPVEVTALPTQAVLEGRSRLTQDDLPGLTVSLIEGGRSVRVDAVPRDTPESFIGRLRAAAMQSGLKVDVLSQDGRIVIRHQEYGSAPTFQAIGSVDGIVSRDAGVVERPQPGIDIAGTIGGEGAVGTGQVLRGQPGNENTEGLAVRYTGPRVATGGVTPEGEPAREYRPVTGTVGIVNVANNALDFQIGPNAGQRISVPLPAIDPHVLSRKVDTDSEFGSLADIQVATPAGARDSLKLIDNAVDELTQMRGRLGAVQKNGLESNLNTLRVTAENLVAAESTIRDTDLAKELAEYTRNRILLEVDSALLAQANHQASTVIHLIK